LDYIVYFKKANGTLSPKVFKLKTFELEPFAQIKIEKNHSLREITTRKYYPGGHGLSVQINGHVRPMRNWTLRIR